MGDLGGIATQARQTRQAFRGVLLPKTHGSTERLRRREQIGSIDKYTRYVSINKIIFMQPSEFLYNNSVKLVIPVLQMYRWVFNLSLNWIIDPRQQKFKAMNGAHLASPIRGELGYAHWPQLGTQFIALLGTKFGAH